MSTKKKTIIPYGTRKAAQYIREWVVSPGLGEHVTIEMQSAPTIAGTFLGFDFSLISVQLDNRTVQSSIPLESTSGLVDSDGNRTDPDDIQTLIAQMRLPLMFSIVYVAEARRGFVDVEDVEYVEVITQRSGKRTGFFVRAAIDAIVLFFAASFRGTGNVGWY